MAKKAVDVDKEFIPVMYADYKVTDKWNQDQKKKFEDEKLKEDNQKVKDHVKTMKELMAAAKKTYEAREKCYESWGVQTPADLDFDKWAEEKFKGEELTKAKELIKSLESWIEDAVDSE